MGRYRSGGLGSFILRAQAARADVEPLRFPTDDDISGMDVSYPAAVGMALGVTDSMPELQGFPAYFTLQFSSLLDYSEKLV